jgi:magnesium transporter
MFLFMKKASKKAGLPPGTLIHVGEKKSEKVRIRIIDYDEENIEEREVETIEETFPYKDTPTVTWINIDGLHEVDVVEKIGTHFGVHPLVLEDILHTGQRPKMDDFESYLFLISRMLSHSEEEDRISSEQFSLILGMNYVISFQERIGDLFEQIRERLRRKRGRIRRMGADYLAYALIDAIIDRYFIVLEKLDERIESLESDLMSNPDPETMQSIHYFKRELIFLRKSVWPLREMVGALERGESNLIQGKTIVFLGDLYDHTIQVIDTIEIFRDMVTGMMDVYLSSISNRMNLVMKVLTIIATIFIPLTFLAGIYGMNFEFMPELKWHWGYPIVLLIMLLIAVIMMIYFWKKKWI